MDYRNPFGIPPGIGVCLCLYSLMPVSFSEADIKSQNQQDAAVHLHSNGGDEARQTFDHFTQDWMRKLIKTEAFQKAKRVTVTKTIEGFVAEYTGYLPHRYTEVKSTKSSTTPFIGILTYYKKQMQSVGKTEQDALSGTYRQAGTSEVSEIFRYTKGRWIY